MFATCVFEDGGERFHVVIWVNDIFNIIIVHLFWQDTSSEHLMSQNGHVQHVTRSRSNVTCTMFVISGVLTMSIKFEDVPILNIHSIPSVWSSENAKSCRHSPGRRRVCRFQRKVGSTLQSRRGPVVVGPRTNTWSAGSPPGSAGWHPSTAPSMCDPPATFSSVARQKNLDHSKKKKLFYLQILSECKQPKMQC